MLILTLGYAMLALVAILICVDATSLYLAQKRLDSLADAAALAGADGFTLTVVDDEPVAALTDDAVHAQAAAIVVAVGGGATLVSAGDAGRSVGARHGRRYVASAGADAVRAGRRRPRGDRDEPHRTALTSRMGESGRPDRRSVSCGACACRRRRDRCRPGRTVGRVPPRATRIRSERSCDGRG